MPNFINKKERLLEKNAKLTINDFINFLINDSFIRSRVEGQDLINKK